MPIPLASSGATPLEALEESEMARRLEGRLAALPENQRRALVLKRFGDLSYQEIAEATELPLGTVKSRLNRARLELATSVRRRVKIRAVPPSGSMAEGSA